MSHGFPGGFSNVFQNMVRKKKGNLVEKANQLQKNNQPQLSNQRLVVDGQSPRNNSQILPLLHQIMPAGQIA